jgi:hypothetical protein
MAGSPADQPQQPAIEGHAMPREKRSHGAHGDDQLARLGRRDGAALVERVTGGKPLPKEVMDEILVRADGVPLFIEELTKTVLLCTATILALTASANADNARRERIPRECIRVQMTGDHVVFNKCKPQSICDWSISQADNPLCKQRPKTQEEWEEREEKLRAVYDRWEEYDAWKKRKARKK